MKTGASGRQPTPVKWVVVVSHLREREKEWRESGGRKVCCYDSA
jgi:hypothetical protein